MGHCLDQMKAQRLASSTPKINDLAVKAGVSERDIVIAENGGAVHVDVSTRIANALGVSLATLGKRDL